MDLANDLGLLAAVIIAIAAIAGFMILRGLILKLVVLGIGLLVAAYVAGLVKF